MSTLYLCGAGNPEGVKLALRVNRAQNRWDRIVILDDDASKHGQSILGTEIAGPFSVLEQSDPGSDEVCNLVARTTKARRSAHEKIQTYGLPHATLIDPGVDTLGVNIDRGVTVYLNAILCANAIVGAESVVLMGALVGHGACVGRGCVVAPGAVINARAELAEGVYIGTNASILPDLKIGPWATIGANSAVVQDVPAEATVMGVPAQLLMQPGGKRSGQTEKVVNTEGQSQARPDEAPMPQSWQIQTQIPALGRLRITQEKFISSYRSTKL